MVVQSKCNNVTTEQLCKIRTNLKLCDKKRGCDQLNNAVGTNFKYICWNCKKKCGRTILTKTRQLVRNITNKILKHTNPLSSMTLLTKPHGMLTTSQMFPSVLFDKEELSHKILTHLLPMLKSTQNSLYCASYTETPTLINVSTPGIKWKINQPKIWTRTVPLVWRLLYLQEMLFHKEMYTQAVCCPAMSWQDSGMFGIPERKHDIFNICRSMYVCA